MKKFRLVLLALWLVFFMGSANLVQAQIMYKSPPT